MATSSMKRISERNFDYWKAQHLLNRAGFGGAPAQVLGLRNMGPADAVDHLLSNAPTESVDGERFDSGIMQPRNEQDRRRIQNARKSGNEAVLEEARMQRQERQRQRGRHKE